MAATKQAVQQYSQISMVFPDKPTVIVADDVEDVRMYIKKVLDDNKINSILCANGKELCEIIQQKNIDFGLILLDLTMPEMNGLQVLQAVQEIKKEKNFKVCILSGHHDPKVIAKASELKADDYLTKPFDKDIFLNRMRGLLGMEKNQLTEFAYVRTKFAASLLKSPILATFHIVGVTEEGLVIESPVNYKEESVLTFSSKEFCEAIHCEQEFNIRVLKTHKSEKEKFIITTSFFSLTEAVASKIRAYAVRNVNAASTSVFS